MRKVKASVSVERLRLLAEFRYRLRLFLLFSEEAALRSGLHMLVYPEGTRSLDGRLSTFKKGPFFLAQETKAPIIPVAISGTQSMMRKGSSAITPGVARIRLLPVIDPADYATRDDLMRAVRSAIAEALPEEMKPADYLTMAL